MKTCEEKKQPLFCVYKIIEEVVFGDNHLWLCVYKIINRGGCYYFWVLTNSNSTLTTSEIVY